MKRSLVSLALLWLCCAVPVPVQAQTLTLVQLAQFTKSDQMQVDASLAKLGWKFTDSKAQGDSIFKVYWGYYNSTGRMIAEVCLRRQAGKAPKVSYSTLLRSAFDAIRTKALSVPMDMQGTSNLEGVMRTYYREDVYDLMLVVSTDEGSIWHTAVIHKHGLTKTKTEKNDGTLETAWLSLTEEQKQRLDTFADSLERRNIQLRAEGLRNERLRKKPRK